MSGIKLFPTLLTLLKGLLKCGQLCVCVHPTSKPPDFGNIWVCMSTSFVASVDHMNFSQICSIPVWVLSQPWSDRWINKKQSPNPILETVLGHADATGQNCLSHWAASSAQQLSLPKPQREEGASALCSAGAPGSLLSTGGFQTACRKCSPQQHQLL